MAEHSEQTPLPDQPSQDSSSVQAVTTTSTFWGTSQWSDWVLDNSRLHYYRARYVSLEDASAVTINSRNSIIPDKYGRYIHYEFLGIGEVLSSPYAPSKEWQLGFKAGIALTANREAALATSACVPCSAITASSTAVNPTVVVPVTTETELEVSQVPTATDTKVTIPNVNHQQVALDMTHAEHKSSGPSRSRSRNEKHAIVFDKKLRKRLRSEKKLRVSSSAKVHQWLIE